jgi:hypothetical protein
MYYTSLESPGLKAPQVYFTGVLGPKGTPEARRGRTSYGRPAVKTALLSAIRGFVTSVEMTYTREWLVVTVRS